MLLLILIFILILILVGIIFPLNTIKHQHRVLNHKLAHYLSILDIYHLIGIKLKTNLIKVYLNLTLILIYKNQQTHFVAVRNHVAGQAAGQIGLKCRKKSSINNC